MINKRLFFIVFSLYLFTACNSDEAAISNLFDDYKAALAAKDYSIICSSLDNKSIDLYKEIAYLASRADSTKLSRKPSFVRYEVLLLRQKLNRDQLVRLSWEDVCQFGIDKIDFSESLAKSELGISKIKEDQAVYYLIIGGQQTDKSLYFKKEGDEWRLNAAKAYSMISKLSYWGSFNADKKAENAALEQSIIRDTGSPLKENIWMVPSDWEK